VTIPRRLIEEVMGKGQPALVLDAAGDDRFAGSASFISSGIRSIVAAPIVDAEGTLGLITLCSRVAVRRFAQPDLDMLVSLASAAALRVRNVALAEELAARRVVEHELALAHEVQMAMLPRAMPAREGLSLAGQLKPARSVGGDLYDVVLEGDHLWFIVADVAGKSIAAALYMAIARALFRASVRGAADVAVVAARMNEELARDNETMMFVTAALGCLDLRTGRVALVDAGHNPMLMSCGAEVREVSGVPKGTAFGVVPDAVYVQGTVALPDGGVLVLYPDGVTEARSAAGEMYGDARLWNALAAGGAAPATLVPHVIASVERFAAGTPPEDDLTLLALAYSPPRR
jgi:sigma-B regulation protein RsbU (phosphoserine phosphatase)